jgi:release factor glutamine methyltransferase
MRLDEWLRLAENRLTSAKIEAARLEASMLAAHILSVDRSWLFAHPEHEFNELAGEQVLQRREASTPLAYILGWREFYGRRFVVTPDVLIPRHETETVVETAIDLAPSEAHVLDLGTGSGCIAVTLKLERPDLKLTATDISPPALSVASLNADRLGAAVDCKVSDAFGAITAEFDLIVTNPPYIGRNEQLDAQVSEFEPHLALYSGEDGMEFFQILASQAKSFLRPGGTLITEVGFTQMPAVSDIFETEEWRVQRIDYDLQGIARVAVIQKTRDP